MPQDLKSEHLMKIGVDVDVTEESQAKMAELLAAFEDLAVAARNLDWAMRSLGKSTEKVLGIDDAGTIACLSGSRGSRHKRRIAVKIYWQVVIGMALAAIGVGILGYVVEGTDGMLMAVALLMGVVLACMGIAIVFFNPPFNP
jgi:hypothetical protein